MSELEKIPTLQEELTRKALSAMTKLVNDRTSGKCTEAEYAYALNVLWESLAGLTDRDFVTMAELMGEGLQVSYSTFEYYLLKTDNKGVVGWVRSIIENSRTGVVTYSVFNNTGKVDSIQIFDYREEPNPLESAMYKVYEIQTRLTENKFIKQ